MAVQRVLAGLVLMAGSCLADLWFEVGDAGQDLATANVTGGVGTLDTIFGNLSAPDPFDSALDVDLYAIYIANPATFSATTVNAPGFYVSDPQLFLFDVNGLGVYMNDDDESGLNGSQSRLPAGHPFGPVSAGFYYLGIGWWDNEPLSAGGEIFSSVNGLGTNGPDLGAGGADPLAGWDNNVLQRADLETAYEITLTGSLVAVPEPGTAGLLVTVFAGLLAIRRRRAQR
jgi:hypothetical protein